MNRIYIILLLILFKIEAYDTSFSELIKEIHEEYYQKQGDWTDCLSEQIKGIVEKNGSSVSFEELQCEGIDSDYLDAMALEYCKKHSDAYIAIIWPTLDESYEKMIYDILSNECLVAYKKSFILKNNAPRVLLQSIPEKVPHISYDFHNYFAQGKDYYLMRCFVIRAPSLQATVRAKRVLRDITKLNPYCMHMDDTHDQVMRTAYMLLNKNSLHYLNNHKLQQFENFNPLFEMYKEFLQRLNIRIKDCCVDGSSVLSAYGIRDCAVDFDFLCAKFGDFGYIHPLDHHNLAWEKLGLSIQDMIYNPKNFFYYKGYKFVSLMNIRNFKALQGRANDIRDVSMIDDMKNYGTE